MIVTGIKIREEIKKGNIVISPLNEENINPNSYNLTLSDKLLIVEDEVIDLKVKPQTKEVTIPEDGYILYPNHVYLASTVEYTETHNFVPVLFGRSSLSRSGLFIHATGGFGDVGYKGNWTLTLVPTVPIKIYPGLKICQIVYFEKSGDAEVYSSEKYQSSQGISASKLYMELNKNEKK